MFAIICLKTLEIYLCTLPMCMGVLFSRFPHTQKYKKHYFMSVEKIVKNEYMEIEHWIICINKYSYSPLDPNGPQKSSVSNNNHSYRP